MVVMKLTDKGRSTPTPDTLHFSLQLILERCFTREQDNRKNLNGEIR